MQVDSRGAAMEPPFETWTRLAQTVTGTLDLAEALDRVARATTDLLPDSAARIWVAEDTRLVLRSEAGTVGAPGAGRKTELALGEGLTGHVALTLQPLIVEDVLADPRTVNVAWVRQQRYVSSASLPLVVRGHLVGVLTLATRHRHRFTAELEILTWFGTQAAMAIHNARLYTETERRRRAAEALAGVGRLISQSLDPAEAGQRIAESIRALLTASASALYRLEADSGNLVAVAISGDAGPAFGRNIIFTHGTGVAGLAVRERQPVVTPNLLTDPRVRLMPDVRACIERASYRAVLAIPLVIQDRVIGALGVGDRAGRVFDAEEIRLARAFADQAAIALENARLYAQAQQAYEELSRTQDQLLQAQKMEAIGRLAGGIAHDFNNLLTVISGHGQLLSRQLHGEHPLRPSLDAINDTAERTAGLTRQLLAFSRKQVLQPRVLDLNAVVADLAPMLQRLIGEDIELATALDPALGHVKADVGQLEQVVLNLAINARDAMPRGGRLMLETANIVLDAAYARQHVEVQPGPYVMLAVSDTGTGMDAPTRARLFEPFFTTKGPGQGTGLGLATSYGIVKQSGGNIWVYSEPGRGTTFKIYLPRVDEPVDVIAPRTDAVEPVVRSGTILLVEDEDRVRALVRTILADHGYTVLDAPHPGDALVSSARHLGPIHLLLTDVVMPQMSGPVLAGRLTPTRPEMKVLYMSGYTDNTVVQHGVLDPGAAFLQKPFTPDTLARTVREVLAGTEDPSAALAGFMRRVRGASRAKPTPLTRPMTSLTDRLRGDAPLRLAWLPTPQGWGPSERRAAGADADVTLKSELRRRR